MVYSLGSETDAPLTERWMEALPGFHVSAPRECELVVRKNLIFPCVRYLGAHTGCGCGFRRDCDGSINTGSDSDDAAASQADHDALVNYLRALPPHMRPRQIYGC